MDFDDTIFDYHNLDRKYNNVIDLIKECKEFGAYVIIFTSCDESSYSKINDYADVIGLGIDKINENLDFIKFSGRKIYYNILLDDRAGLKSAYNILKQSLNIMKGLK